MLPGVLESGVEGQWKWEVREGPIEVSCRVQILVGYHHGFGAGASHQSRQRENKCSRCEREAMLRNYTWGYYPTAPQRQI